MYCFLAEDPDRLYFPMGAHKYLASRSTCWPDCYFSLLVNSIHRVLVLKLPATRGRRRKSRWQWRFGEPLSSAPSPATALKTRCGASTPHLPQWEQALPSARSAAARAATAPVRLPSRLLYRRRCRCPRWTWALCWRSARALKRRCTGPLGR